MISKKPALGLDPGVGTCFRKRSCSDKKLEPGSDSIGMDQTLGIAGCSFAACDRSARGNEEWAYSGFSTGKIAMNRIAQIAPWVLHDLRRTYATNLAALRTPPHVIEKLLNHVTGQISGVAAIYNRFQYQDEMREAITKWETRLGALLDQSSGPQISAAA